MVVRPKWLRDKESIEPKFIHDQSPRSTKTLCGDKTVRLFLKIWLEATLVCVNDKAVPLPARMQACPGKF